MIATREQARPKTGYPSREAIEAFDRLQCSETPRVGYWLDNSDLTVAETMDDLLLHLDQAVVPYPLSSEG